MRYSYPADINPQEGGYLVTFPDIPEAITEGDTFEEAEANAVDCLVTALSFYVDGKEDIPAASVGTRYIDIPPVPAAKLALYTAMRGHISNVELGRRMGVTEGAIRRLLDLRHRSHIDQVARALELLGRRIVLDVEAA
jgi:antitoxin HicB